MTEKITEEQKEIIISDIDWVLANIADRVEKGLSRELIEAALSDMRSVVKTGEIPE